MKDALGSITEITDESGTIIQRYSYSSFGKILKVQNESGQDLETPLIKTHYAFTNREFDEEIGLYYYRARYYDANSGRFIQADPIPGVQGLPLTVNSPYIYALNNPAMNVDPSGKILPVLAVAFIVGGSLNSYLARDNGKPWYQNFYVGGGIAAGGVVVGAAGIWAGASLATYMGGSAMAGAMVGGGIAGGGYSYGVQRIMNPKAPVNWLAVGFGVFAGALGGALSYGNVGAAAESVDTFNKTAAGALLDTAGPPAPSVTPGVPIPVAPPTTPAPYVCAPIGQFEPNPICF